MERREGILLSLFLTFLLVFLKTIFGQDKTQFEISGLINITKDQIVEYLEKNIKDLNDESEIKICLEKWGFFSKVEVRLHVNNNDQKIIKIDVLEYPKINGVAVYGNTIFKEEELIGYLSIKTGEVFNKTNFYKNIKKLYYEYAKRGYTQVEIDHIELTKEGNLSIFVTEWKVGSWSPASKFKTKPEIIDRFLVPEKNSLYNLNRIKMAIEDLYYTDAFENINVTVERTNIKGVLNLKVELQEKPPLLNLDFQYLSYGGMKSEFKYNDLNFLGNLENIGLGGKYYKIKDNVGYVIWSEWNESISQNSRFYLGMDFKLHYITKGNLFLYDQPFKLTKFSWQIFVKKDFSKYSSVFLGLRPLYSSVLNDVGKASDDLSISPFFKYKYESSNMSKSRATFFELETEYFKNLSGLVNIIFGMNAQHEFTMADNIRNVLRADAGIIAGKDSSMANKFIIGNDKNYHYLKYDELLLDRYASLNYKMVLPPLRHFLILEFFSDFIYGDVKEIKRSVNYLIYGLGVKVTNLPIYASVSFNENLKKPVFSVSFNFQ